MTRQQHQDITEAINAVAAGNPKVAVRLLCRTINRRDVPAIVKSPDPPQRRAPVRSECATGAQPKPERRIQSPKAIAQYKTEIGKCETGGDDCSGPLDFSHIKPRSAGGDDTPDNGMIQCRRHHEQWHRGPLTFIANFAPRLKAPLRMKIARALGLELEAA